MQADNSRYLIAAARQRAERTRQQALTALRRLDAKGVPITFEAVAREAGVSPAEQRARRHLTPYHRVGQHEGRAPDMAARQHDAPGGDPDTVLDDDGPRLQCHVGAEGVCAGCQKAFLAHHDIAADLDPVLVVDPDALADPGPRAHRELPRKLHPEPRTHDDVLTDLGAEKAKHAHPNVRADLERVGDQ